MGMPISRREPTEPAEAPNRRDEIAEALRARIGAGEFVPGAEVPSGREIAREYNCAPMTAHAALRILADDGVITIRPGRGSTVAQAEKSIAGPAERLARSRDGGLFREGEQQQILRARLDVGHLEARAALGVDGDEPLGAREYLVRNAAGTVITYATSFVHPDVWAAVAELRERRPIPDGIIGAVRRTLGRATVATPTRRKASYASESEAEALGIAVDAPVLVEITVCLDAQGRVVEWNVSAHPEGYWVGGA
jgi:DNA-binding GntR family transcriptional regulator